MSTTYHGETKVGLILMTLAGPGYWLKFAGGTQVWKRVWLKLSRQSVFEYLTHVHPGCAVFIDDYEDFMEDATPMARVKFRVEEFGEMGEFAGDFWLERAHTNHAPTLYGEW